MKRFPVNLAYLVIKEERAGFRFCDSFQPCPDIFFFLNVLSEYMSQAFNFFVSGISSDLAGQPSFDPHNGGIPRTTFFKSFAYGLHADKVEFILLHDCTCLANPSSTSLRMLLVKSNRTD